MSSAIDLSYIQKQQFSDKAGAERNLLEFLTKHEDPQIKRVELTPKPESLNSINGFVTYANGKRYFFKTHSEENEKIEEYYNAERLAQSGYPVITAKQIRQRPGQQIALYEVITWPTLFDLVKAEEDSLLAGKPMSEGADALIAEQEALDKKVFNIYRDTLKEASAEEHAAAPIQQLFWHRLADDGRMGLFYKDKRLAMDEDEVTFSELAGLRWVINGLEYRDNLGDIIERARRMLEPRQGPSIVGHGDAHNGNLFVDPDSGNFKLFDPAFAGRHQPLLDLTKPLFHNVFARWMYFPEQAAGEFELKCSIVGGKILVDHSFSLSAMRRAFLRSRIENVLRPTLKLLAAAGSLDSEWRDYLRSALFCCPFLTVNLFAQPVANGTLSERYSLPIKLLGLSLAVELGSTPLADAGKASEAGEAYSLRAAIDDIFSQE